MTARTETVRKRVEFKQTDAARQIATGIVMVPDSVDLQGDFVREGIIQQFSEQFMADLASADENGGQGGIMHAAWPADHIELTENTVVDEPMTVGETEVPEGAWVQSWKMNDDALWSLVTDGVLSGYSIGATHVEWSEPIEQTDLPDAVAVAADYPTDEPVFEILDGQIKEVSAVDLPAVPQAEILATKAAGETSVLEHVGGKNEFVGMMRERGHTEDDAERLWHYLQRALDETDEKTAPTPNDGFLRRLGTAAWTTLTGGTNDQTTVATDGGTEKESRTLSQANRERLMAAHDALETALSSDVTFESNRFTDNPTFAFDVSEYRGKSTATDTDSIETDTTTDETTAPETDTTMSDDDPFADAPEWAKAMHEETKTNSDRIDTLTEKVAGNEDNTDAWTDAPAWAKAMRDEQKELDERVENLAKASGKSQQLSGSGTEEIDGPTKADFFGLPGGDA